MVTFTDQPKTFLYQPLKDSYAQASEGMRVLQNTLNQLPIDADNLNMNTVIYTAQAIQKNLTKIIENARWLNENPNTPIVEGEYNMVTAPPRPTPTPDTKPIRPRPPYDPLNPDGPITVPLC